MASEGPRFDPLQTHHSSSIINRRCVMCGSVAKWIMRPTSTLFFAKRKTFLCFFSKNSRYNFEQTKTSSSSSSSSSSSFS